MKYISKTTEIEAIKYKGNGNFESPLLPSWYWEALRNEELVPTNGQDPFFHVDKKGKRTEIKNGDYLVFREFLGITVCDEAVFNTLYEKYSQLAPAQGAEEAAGTYAKGLIGEYDPVYQEEYDAICSHFLSGVEYEKRKQQNAAPNCCARWVKASERLPEIGSYVEAWSDPKMDFSSTNIAITRFTRYGFEGAANVTHWRNIIGPDESPCTCQQELEELRAWKKQATEVMPDFQAIGKELGIPLGQTVHDKILTGIKKLKEKATVSSIGARWVKGEDLPDKDGTYICEKKPVSNNNTYFERVFFNNGKFQTAHKVVKWLDESTVTLEAGWMPGTPPLDKPCVFVSKSGDDYSVWQVTRRNTVDGSYLTICDGEGDEWGDTFGFKCDSYYMLSPYSFPTRDQAIEKVSWLDKEDPQLTAAIAMYDWIIEQINKH